MKRCPACNRTYTDDSLVFCLDDGSSLVNSYDPQATLLVPAPRATDGPPVHAYQATPAPYQTQKRNRWPLYILGLVIFLFLAGGVVTLLLFGYARMSTSSEANSNQESAKRTDSPTSPSPPTAQSLVGVWRAEVNEDGERSTITVTFLANGDSRYLIKNEKGETGTDTGTWQYSDETIFERFSNGSSGRASIRWID